MIGDVLLGVCATLPLIGLAVALILGAVLWLTGRVRGQR